jgi:hypothetical protein
MHQIQRPQLPRHLDHAHLPNAPHQHHHVVDIRPRKVQPKIRQRLLRVVIIDGLTRGDLFDIASKYVAPNGIIICDNAEGYGFYEGFKDRGFSRVDFYGNAPGILLPHCTSIFFARNVLRLRPRRPHPQRSQKPLGPVRPREAIKRRANARPARSAPVRQDSF